MLAIREVRFIDVLSAAAALTARAAARIVL